MIELSALRPHFCGGAFVRVGSETIRATEEQYRKLLLAQDDKRRYFLDHPNEMWTIEFIRKNAGSNAPTMNEREFQVTEGTVRELTAFFVRFDEVGTGRSFTEMLDDIHISYDDSKHRPRAVIWPTGR